MPFTEHTVLLLLTIGTAYAKIEVTTVPSSVTVKPGEDVLLNCFLKVDTDYIDLKQLMVQWFHRGKQIAEFDNTITIDKPGVSLSVDELMKGNVSLLISSTKVEDSGNYRCYVYYQSAFRMKQIVLAVQESGQGKEEEEIQAPVEPVPKNDPETLQWVIQVKKAVDHLQETINLMKTDVEKCAAGREYKTLHP
ncbi:hypothetical protein NDU88_003538 [Pleurodeles waltl]|uniref:Ig-like domain-containing protein n=1 Tax=Pleurodeles waltl TaxID=8319 RepID=A0AAV7PAB3_PLEWA|nr:hypothetical protein NDU88_003538 [Pleurodeles waltl]